VAGKEEVLIQIDMLDVFAEEGEDHGFHIGIM